MTLPPEYFIERVTAEDVGAGFDFGACHPGFRADWERLLSQRVDGDDLWRFASPPGHLKVSGIALVRDGEVVSTFVEPSA